MISASNSRTVSLQPWLSLDSLVVLIAGLAWIYYVTTLDLHLRDVRMAARLFAAGMIASRRAVSFPFSNATRPSFLA